MTSDPQHSAFLSSLLQSFPSVRHAFAYGSGVFVQPEHGRSGDTTNKQLPQASTSGREQPLLDFIFAVESPVEWHRQNMQYNRHHYSGIARLGPEVAASVASRIGAGVHFNTMVPMNGKLIKYGVTSARELIDDLTTWRHLYIAGRMQKPVLTLQRSSSIDAAVQGNVQSALTASLLMMPKVFTTKDILRTICRLSYSGDIRMGFAEDRHKVSRIVEGSWYQLCSMYVPQLQGRFGSSARIQQVEEQVWKQEGSQESRTMLAAQLPSAVLQRLAQRLALPYHLQAMATDNGTGSSGQWRDEVAHALAAMPTMSKLLAGAVASIVAASSRRQAVASFLSAGGLKSISYVGRKMMKALKSRLK